MVMQTKEIRIPRPFHNSGFWCGEAKRYIASGRVLSWFVQGNFWVFVLRA